MANEISDIPSDMRKVYRRLRRWRSSHSRRVPFPDALWAAAGELAREHGINRTAKALSLEYGKLKERAGAAGPARKIVRKVPSAIPRHARPPVPATFMELITPRPGSVASAVVELDGPQKWFYGQRSPEVSVQLAIAYAAYRFLESALEPALRDGQRVLELAGGP